MAHRPYGPQSELGRALYAVAIAHKIARAMTDGRAQQAEIFEEIKDEERIHAIEFDANERSDLVDLIHIIWNDHSLAASTKESRR